MQCQVRALREKVQTEKQLDNLIAWEKKGADREFALKVEMDEGMNSLFSTVDKKGTLLIDRLIKEERELLVGSNILSVIKGQE